MMNVRTVLLAASTLALLASGSSKKPAPLPPPAPPVTVKAVRQLSTTGAGSALTRITDDPKAEEYPRMSGDGVYP